MQTITPEMMQQQERVNHITNLHWRRQEATHTYYGELVDKTATEVPMTDDEWKEWLVFLVGVENAVLDTALMQRVAIDAHGLSSGVTEVMLRKTLAIYDNVQIVKLWAELALAGM